MCTESEAAGETAFCMATKAMDEQPKVSAVQVISREAAKAAGVADKAAKNAEAAKIALANTESTYLYSAIGYSVLAILIIVLILKKENE
ncbi:hypothetical protein PFFVO_06192 [Plasmodium falciparum Vietnam Oak-Knoll (FVO)]|uniref:Surface antigen n=1 Tax=Plasmodium falciparum Vietnam Oak-Knoll (FVO) TaxID=1036723 RepID=A0A024UY18_PLAFA|nr:hypothetical protein PFFVO_06192 [Plasmodium falciparum Vietnam Oak-Knoll (FVO)]